MPEIDISDIYAAAFRASCESSNISAYNYTVKACVARSVIVDVIQIESTSAVIAPVIDCAPLIAGNKTVSNAGEVKWSAPFSTTAKGRAVAKHSLTVSGTHHAHLNFAPW